MAKADTFLRQILTAILVSASLQSAAPKIEAQQDTAGGGEPPYVEPLTEPMAVIPPGREDLLAQMLGRGETLDGPCTFSSGKIENDTVNATYACPGGTVVVILRHPEKADSGATLTDKFAIVVQSGTPPPTLIEQLALRIRAREAAFEWTWLQPPPGQPANRPVALIIVVVLLAAAALWLALRRRRA